MEFKVHAPLNTEDTVEVRYDCPCGCKPRARYQRDTDEADHEHCCCGRVHFVGAQADQRLEAYLAERRTQGEDEGLTYSFESSTVEAPWGESVPVVFATPDKLHKH